MEQNIYNTKSITRCNCGYLIEHDNGAIQTFICPNCKKYITVHIPYNHYVTRYSYWFMIPDESIYNFNGN